MTNIDTQIIFDKNGNPIPQYLDVSDKTGGSAGTMKPITGQNGAQFTQLTGSIEVIAELGVTTVTAGSEIEVLPYAVRDNFRELRYAFRTYPEGDFSIGVRYRSSFGELYPTKNIDLGIAFNGSGVLEEQIKYNRYSVFFRNNSSGNRNITSISILGVK